MIRRSTTATTTALALAAAAAGLPATPAAAVTEQVSVNSAGRPANAYSQAPAISGDGRYVTFFSPATNLAPGDDRHLFDVFVRDRSAGTTTLVSHGKLGFGGVGGSGGGRSAISRDGRYVAFDSTSADLVAGDTNAKEDVFVRDLEAGATVRASLRPAGRQTDGDSRVQGISADGRYVLFSSDAPDLASLPGAAGFNIYLRDLRAGTTTVAAASSEFDGARITPGGRYLVFTSSADGLVAGHPAGQVDVYRPDRRSGAVTLVSATPGGGFPNGSSRTPRVSDDGRYVAFSTAATDLAAPGSPAVGLYVRDLRAGITTPILAPGGDAPDNITALLDLSADGRVVLLESFATNLVKGDTNGEPDAFLQDLRTRATVRVSVGTQGQQANGATFEGALSADGRAVAFDTEATNLVPGTTQGQEILVRAPASP